MKTCTICKNNKEISDFNKNATKKDGLSTVCRECSKIHSRQYYSINREAHKVTTKARKDRNIEIARRKMVDFLKSHPCEKCGESDILVLQFDHLRDKKNDVGEMINMGFGWDKIKEEMDKCQVLCANCHLRKTAHQLNFYKLKYL